MKQRTPKHSLEFLLQKEPEVTSISSTTSTTLAPIRSLSPQILDSSHSSHSQINYESNQKKLTWMPSQSDLSPPTLHSNEPTFVFYEHERDSKISPFQNPTTPAIIQPRNRRRFHEVERSYDCTFEGCNKSYGALSHLNTHIALKNHGEKRMPEEFKSLRDSMRDSS